MDSAIREALELQLGATITRVRPIGGGCINEARACTLGDGRDIFVKFNPGCDASMFATEAAGLRWLAEAEAVRIPEVLAVGDEYLALEYIEAGRSAADFDEQLGRGLAALHQHGAEGFGLGHDNFLATLPQDNRAEPSWQSFYAEKRLRPLLRLAVDTGRAPRNWIALFETLFARMPELVGDDVAPARLHGDLWSGNVHTDSRGAPVLVDPAVYGGHREIDLAMLRLFGSPSADFFAAYEDVWPLSPGHANRILLYQLYPLLAHVNLFGSSYCASCERALRTYL